jgi:hypothetical protein
MTTSNRYEIHDRDWLPYWGTIDNARFGYSLDAFKARRGGIYLTSAEDQVYATLNLTTRGINVSNALIGEATQQFSVALSGPVATH